MIESRIERFRLTRAAGVGEIRRLCLPLVVKRLNHYPAIAIRFTNKYTTLETSNSEDDNTNPSPAVFSPFDFNRSADDESLLTTTAIYESPQSSAESVLAGLVSVLEARSSNRPCFRLANVRTGG